MLLQKTMILVSIPVRRGYSLEVIMILAGRLAVVLLVLSQDVSKSVMDAPNRSERR